MTSPYGCRLQLCELYGECDPLSPIAGCPLLLQVCQDRSSGVSQACESVVVSETDEQHAAALCADSLVGVGGGLVHAESNGGTEIGIVQKVVGDLRHAGAR